ncbi:CHRD domain-containing protein [Nonomuraea maritima]|uniref:CHRD domain-containing protein n=1 Tax=Nonomuraea maritima TaxID=683260 RepID=A0A1G9DVL6_9ACTN|nr:CHRD domain-containing protein [Nonomuraea maritima]SDK67937.1 CHRD domain-containing protein [Nonomuraea maritima]
MNIVKQSSGKGISWQRLASRGVMGAVAAALAVGAMSAPAGASTASTASTTSTVSHPTTAAVSTTAASQARTSYFASVLLGRNEVREKGKKVNDRDGIAVAKFRIQGNRLFFLVQWKKVARPTALHIHRGRAGVNGPVVIDLLSNGRTRGNTTVGSVVVKDLSVLNGIKANPRTWYANLHTKQFADGAVRGQLVKGGRW